MKGRAKMSRPMTPNLPSSLDEFKCLGRPFGRTWFVDGVWSDVR